ncbi:MULTISPECIES: hypothetical protein [Colwelliaceae]|uniref:Uncharacterized protein n=2 Tax=Colwelliaceae TaxID=267889 RepID=A0A7X0NKG5_9GAMM|nr:MULTISPECIES: hypothetical protein [Colwelliaceae]MBB6545078.1 hypothetical protein [Thalassotalea piscium]SEL93091.1 hypothetical protein SAMN05216262_1358 [Colwellia chukchiensis]
MSNIQQPSYMQVLGQLNLEDIYIQQMFDYYHECFEANEQYQQFVLESSRIPDELRDHSYAGICDRTLGTEVPKARSLSGGAMRGTMQTVGLIRSSGSELFRGCAVFPKLDERGQIISAVGYRFGKRIRHWQQEVVYWEKPKLDGYVHEGLAFVKEVIYGKACH